MEEFQKSDSLACPVSASQAEQMSYYFAMLPKDGKWYRKKVMKILKNFVVVRFLDFGFNMKLTNSRRFLRKMDEKFCEESAYAMREKLANYVHFEGSNATQDGGRTGNAKSRRRRQGWIKNLMFFFLLILGLNVCEN